MKNMGLCLYITKKCCNNITGRIGFQDGNCPSHKLCIWVDWVSHSFMGKKDLLNSWPLCLTKLSLYLFLLFAIFGNAHTFYQKIKRVEGVSCLSYWQFSTFQLLHFQTKKLVLPCPSHLNCHIYPNTWSVAQTSNRWQLVWTLKV